MALQPLSPILSLCDGGGVHAQSPSCGSIRGGGQNRERPFTFERDANIATFGVAKRVFVEAHVAGDSGVDCVVFPDSYVLAWVP
jgi:hypothetical protein